MRKTVKKPHNNLLNYNNFSKLYVSWTARIKTHDVASNASGFMPARKRTTPRCILAQHYTRRVLGTTQAEGAQAVRTMPRCNREKNVIAFEA